jgi:branched-subunit amino acid ABC-type transport system permease component
LSLDIYVNILIGGLLTGLIYGLSALGLSVIFGVVRIVNFAHGEMMVGAMFLTMLMVRHLGIDPLLCLPAVALLLFCVGFLLQRFVISRVAHLADHMQFLLMVAIATTLVAGYLMIFGPDDQSIQLSYAYDSFAFGGIIIDKARVYAAVAALVVTAGDRSICCWERLWAGVGTLFGPIFGAMLLTPLGELLTAATSDVGIPGAKEFVWGLVVAAIVLVQPAGLWPLVYRALGLGGRNNGDGR